MMFIVKGCSMRKYVIMLFSLLVILSCVGCSKQEDTQTVTIDSLQKDIIVEVEDKNETSYNELSSIEKDIDYYKANCMDNLVIDFSNTVYRVSYDDNSHDTYLYSKPNEVICVFDAIKNVYFALYNTGTCYIGSSEGFKSIKLENVGLDDDFMINAFADLESKKDTMYSTYYVGEILDVNIWEEHPEYTFITTTARQEREDENNKFTAVWCLNTITDEFERVVIDFKGSTSTGHDFYYRPDSALINYDLTKSEDELKGLVTEELTGLKGIKEFMDNIEVLKETLTVY